ncbi:MAG: GntR family transcriptional regulator, partial [Desulfofustis sp.]|nr:GntR family transcriptional regulator [Desulfofustis sp.]
LGAQVAEMLTTAILEGQFKGGDQLVEQELQLRFGVSRSPLREAFRELEKNGLVDILPRRGTFVKRISRTDIQEHFPVRAVLEGLAARLAARLMQHDTLAALADTLNLMKTAVAAGDTGAYYRHHLVFHELFIQSSGNELLIATLQTLRMQNLWHRFSYQYYQESLENSFQVHQRIYDLFANQQADDEEIGRLVEDHINVALDRFLDYLSKCERADGQGRL